MSAGRSRASRLPSTARVRARPRAPGALSIALAFGLVSACTTGLSTSGLTAGAGGLAAAPTLPGTGAGPGATHDAADGDPSLSISQPGAGPWVMPASWLDTANIAWLATDPPDPPPTPEPTASPTPTPASTSRPAAGVPANAWRIPILMYHLVTAPVPADAIPGLVVPPGLFDAQMHALRDAGWRTITVRDLAAALRTGSRPPPKTMAVSFDDGHVDSWTQVVPVLQRYGFVGTFYVITDRFDWGEFLKSDQLVAMHGLGMEVANHTMAHVDLTAVPYAKAYAQVDGGSGAIEALVGLRPVTMAYPYGTINASATRAAAAAGIQIATTTVNDCLIYPGNALAVPRIRVSPWNTAADLVAMLRPCTG